MSQLDSAVARRQSVVREPVEEVTLVVWAACPVCESRLSPEWFADWGGCENHPVRAPLDPSARRWFLRRNATDAELARHPELMMERSERLAALIAGKHTERQAA